MVGTWEPAAPRKSKDSGERTDCPVSVFWTQTGPSPEPEGTVAVSVVVVADRTVAACPDEPLCPEELVKRTELLAGVALNAVP